MGQDARSIAEALALEGVEDPAALATARAVLDEEKVTNPARDRVANAKQDRIREVLSQRFFRHCSQAVCLGRAQHSGLMPLVVRKDACQACGGSNIRRAVEDMVRACHAAGIRRVCVVGGSPAVREELVARVGDALSLTLVDGTRTPNAAQARAHVRGHDVVVLCGASELDHRLSNTYSAWRQEGRFITVARRGVEAIAEELARHASTRV
ncbi:MAG: hypothetical protein HY904_04195 [Deltaproteobacteria bacterium]|nr:hypothetical protein [Deltaproteobacteria bacterium]